MKINDIQESDLEDLEEGNYILFDKEDTAYEIVEFGKIGYAHKSGKKYCFRDVYGEYGPQFLDGFKEDNKDCEMFHVNQIKKPE